MTMFVDIEKFEDQKSVSIYTNKKGVHYSDNIYIFDIEVTSLFLIDGKYQVFDKTISDYSNIDKKSVVYHCQFSVNDVNYSFRCIEDFEKILIKMSNLCEVKTIWVFNLPYEFQFLIPILSHYTITNLVARDTRKPISFRIKELNIEFRCLFALTNMNLARSAERYAPHVHKAVGDLDYNISRSPLTTLNDQELYYCEMDCICPREIIRYFLQLYGHIKNIPLTQTGRMRREYKKVVPKFHYKYVRSLVPTLEEYKILKNSFMGGITHGNALHVGDYITEVDSADICSSYPYAMVSEQYPCENFRPINPNAEHLYDDAVYCKIYVVTMVGVCSKLYNHYISYSKCQKSQNEKLDNGRLISADIIDMTLTDVDFNMIKRCYKIKKIIFNEVWVAKKDYLPKYFIEFILKLYNDKTALKGVNEQEDYYLNQKEYLNATYGACVMDVVQSSVYFDSEKLWQKVARTDEFINEKIRELEESYSLFVFSHGVYITAYARQNLFERLLDNDCELDYDVIYYDTDSLKVQHMVDHEHIFKRYNKNVKLKLLKIALHYNIPFDHFKPKDRNGNEHMIGLYDLDDGHYSEFITLGAKRYCYRDKKDGQLHITVSGVSKDGVVALKNDIHNFNTKLFFSYEDCHKNISLYNDHQEPFTFTDKDGNNYHYSWASGIVIYPTTYKMTIDYDFADYVNMLAEMVVDRNTSNDSIINYKKHSQRNY